MTKKTRLCMVTVHGQWIPVENVHYATTSRKEPRRRLNGELSAETVDYKSFRKGVTVLYTHLAYNPTPIPVDLCLNV